jgi:hypothetical protein
LTACLSFTLTCGTCEAESVEGADAEVSDGLEALQPLPGACAFLSFEVSCPFDDADEEGVFLPEFEGEFD